MARTVTMHPRMVMKAFAAFSQNLDAAMAMKQSDARITAPAIRLAALGSPAGEHASGRVFVVEGVIDALAARALEAGRQGTEGTTYASTGGAFGVRTAAAISALLRAGGGHLVAGVDRGEVGESFAVHLRHVAAGSRATYS